MGDSLYSQDGYPPGVSNSHPHFHSEDDPPCYCGHVFDEHMGEGGGCDVDGCDCDFYDPDLEDDRAPDAPEETW